MKLIAHGLVSDLAAMVRAGYPIPQAEYFCTDVGFNWLFPDQDDHGAEHLALRCTDMPQWRDTLGKLDFDDFEAMPDERLARRCAGDAEAAWRLAPLVESGIKEAKLEKIWNLAMLVLPILAEIGGRGMAVAMGELQSRVDILGPWLQEEKAYLESTLGIENVGSDIQVAKALFGPLRATPLEQTQRGWSVKKRCLLWARYHARKRQQHDLDALLTRLMEYNAKDKLYSTYYLPWLSDGTGRVGSYYSLGKAATGRLASSRFNLQNVPAIARQLVIPSPGYDLILQCDFKSFELAGAAHVSCDPVMIDWITRGLDMHSIMASKVMGLPEPKTAEDFSLFKKKYKIQRDTGKMSNFACLVPKARVFKADLTWVPIESLNVGDIIFGFNEDLKAGRDKLRQRSLLVQKSEVLATSRQYLPVYRVTTDKGVLAASENHQWVVMPCNKTNKHPWLRCKTWLRTDQLSLGDHLAFWLPSWEFDDSHESGYISGFLDGEGSLVRHSRTNQHCISLGNNPGPYLDRFIQYLEERCHVSFGIQKKARRIYVTRQDDVLRILGTTRPTRLLEKVWREEIWYKYPKTAIIKQIEFLGVQETVGLTTTTGTLISEGFFTHNSIYLVSAESLRWQIFEDTDGQVYLPEDEVQKYIDMLFTTFKKYDQYVDQLWADIHAGKWIRSDFGRRWQFEPTNAGLRRATNYPVQSACSDLTILALYFIYHELKRRKMKSRLINEVHDSMGFETTHREVKTLCEIVKEVCEETIVKKTQEMFGFTMRVPIRIDIQAGSCWGGLEEIE